MFICNYCPYVRAVANRVARDASNLQKRGIGVIAVMPKDDVQDPDDAPKQMKRFAKEHDFSFPTSSTRCRRWCARSRGGTAGSAPPISVANNLPPIKLAPPTAHCIAFRPTRSAPSSD